MPRERFKTLTEQMFYTLLCLTRECSGKDILDMVPKMTNSRVSIGSGTLYTLLDQFVTEGMIMETRVEGRKRNYMITFKGRKMLDDEYERLKKQQSDYIKFTRDYGGLER